jgi:hypothetical protein
MLTTPSQLLNESSNTENVKKEEEDKRSKEYSSYNVVPFHFIV